MTELQHFVQITDKWSKRRFALRLESPKRFPKVGQMIDYLQLLTLSNIDELLENGDLGQMGEQGLEDIRTALFAIEDDGTLGSRFEEIKLKQKGRTLKNDDPLKFEHVTTEKEGYADIYVSRLILDRDDLPFLRNWEGFYKRRWDQNPGYEAFVESIIQSRHGDESERILQLQDAQAKIDFLQAVSSVIYDAPYELYSRFIGRTLRFKNGPDTLECIMDGKGGNCSEKASALEFITSNYGFESQIISGGDQASGPFPSTRLRRALDDFDFAFKDKAQLYWSHNANYVEVEGTPILIDATGGSIPYLFCVGDEAEAYFSQEKSSKVLFVAQEEEYFYHKSPDDITYDMLFAMENFLPEIDVFHVFGPDGEESPFGFILTKDLWVCPSAYKTAEEFGAYKRDWMRWADGSDHVTKIEVVSNLDASPDKTILARLEHESPRLMADIRTANEGLIQRCRQEWRNKQWNISYVFAEFK